MLAVSTGSGFIGGIIAGFLAGYIAKLISTQLKLPQSMEALKPILIIPLISSNLPSKRVKNYWPGRKNKGRSAPPLSNVKIGR